MNEGSGGVVFCEGLGGLVSDEYRHRQGAPWSWKVMEFRKTIFQAWKVMENSKGHGKVMENDGNVMKFLLLH